MSERKIGLIGEEGEEHCDRMRDVFRRLKVKAFILDLFKFPEAIEISSWDGIVKFNGKILNNFCAFYVRTVPIGISVIGPRKSLPKRIWQADYLIERERHSFLCSFINSLSLRGKLIVNPVSSFDLHFLKLYQIELLSLNGIPMPVTLVTNSPKEVMAFKKKHGEIVYKPVAGGASCKLMVKEDFSQERMKELKNAPVLFQKYIEGDNIRAYAVGKKVVASAIIHTKAVDYRGAEERLEQVILPKEIQRLCVKAKNLCGMHFSGIDLKRQKNGKYVFIECNPSPMFVGFEDRTGSKISEALAKYILQNS